MLELPIVRENRLQNTVSSCAVECDGSRSGLGREDSHALDLFYWYSENAMNSRRLAAVAWVLTVAFCTWVATAIGAESAAAPAEGVGPPPVVPEPADLPAPPIAIESAVPPVRPLPATEPEPLTSPALDTELAAPEAAPVEPSELNPEMEALDVPSAELESRVAPVSPMPRMAEPSETSKAESAGSEHLKGSGLGDKALAGPVFCPNGRPCSDFFDCDPCCPYWSVSGGAIALKRSDAFSLPLLAGGNEFDVEHFNFDLEVGPRVDVIYHVPSGWEFEALYYGVGSWASLHPFENGNLQLLGVEPEPIDVDSALFRYGSELYSTEFNLRRRMDWLTPLIGFRWVELEEQFGVAGLEPPTPGIPYSYRYDTHNHMYGVQVGAEVILWNRGGPLRVDGVFKAGMYYNEADLDAAFGYGPVPDEAERIVFEQSRAEPHTSFLGEVGVGASWQASDWLNLRGGYQLTWIEGVALAPEQIPSTDLFVPFNTEVNTGGSPLYHGPYAAIEARW